MAHICLHKFKWGIDTVFKAIHLPSRKKAFLWASIEIDAANRKKQEDDQKRKSKKGGSKSRRKR